MIFGIHIYQVKTVLPIELSPLLLIELSPLNELYRGKLVNSIIVNIPYLLALTLSIISSNINILGLLIIYFEVGVFAIPSDGYF